MIPRYLVNHAGYHFPMTLHPLEKEKGEGAIDGERERRLR